MYQNVLKPISCITIMLPVMAKACNSVDWSSNQEPRLCTLSMSSPKHSIRDLFGRFCCCYCAGKPWPCDLGRQGRGCLIKDTFYFTILASFKKFLQVSYCHPSSRYSLQQLWNSKVKCLREATCQNSLRQRCVCVLYIYSPPASRAIQASFLPSHHGLCQRHVSVQTCGVLWSKLGDSLRLRLCALP